MTEFIRGLFGSKEQKQADDTEAQAPAPKDAYYLDYDDATTMGNTEYMRSAKRVKRTFPKTLSGQAAAWDREISAMEMRDSKLGPKPSIGSTVGAELTVETNGSKPTVPTEVEVAARRKTDTNLDMFRNMAKEIRK